MGAAAWHPSLERLAPITPVDPWDLPEIHPSPDGGARLMYFDLTEISGWGGPLVGSIELLPLRPGLGERCFGGPPVWSPDGRFVAIPEWSEPEAAGPRQGRRTSRSAPLAPGTRRTPPWPRRGGAYQVVTVFDLAQRREASTIPDYRVVHLTRFVGQTVTGTDSPLEDPRPLVVALETLDWRPMGERRAPPVGATRRSAWEAAIAWGGHVVWLGILALMAVGVLAWRGCRALWRRDDGREDPSP